METKKEIKSLQDIVKEGYNWHDGLVTIIVDLCKKVKVLEDKVLEDKNK